ncbi:hypothetical protein [uncultured Nitrospira sp.]|uniref:hypothetical protein n=1 Tax=uncultured Nitrospira sp. TaxID=157176 RepID=UPI003140890C
MRRLSLIFLAILAMGCGHFPQAQMDGWKGVHREELIRVMGTPTKQTALPDGGERLEFIQRITRHPLGGEVYGTSYECHKTFEIDSEGIVQQAVSEPVC